MSEHFAIISFVVEPCEGHIGFQNEAVIQADLRGNKNLEIGIFIFTLTSLLYRKLF
ncbi:hypothetical protein MHI37_02725 [Paenibacillus sp. FSL H8-0548]|uniref:hypothetical protein n=1 Tax=Paenibacillus sp. FSL H8-0548 TaxID=1920422 RepID=UPI0015C4036F|nr:hypothetical protein [Paenibacillus sp. FSL H8-0548]